MLKSFFASKIAAGLFTATVVSATGVAGAVAIHHSRSGVAVHAAAHARHKAAKANGQHHSGHYKGSAVDAMRPFAIAAKMIGIKTQVLYDDVMKHGMTIAQVAAQHGVDPNSIVAALTRAGAAAGVKVHVATGVHSKAPVQTIEQRIVFNTAGSIFTHTPVGATAAKKAAAKPAAHVHAHAHTPKAPRVKK